MLISKLVPPMRQCTYKYLCIKQVMLIQNCILAAKEKQKKYILNLYFIHTDKYMLISLLYATSETMHRKICMYLTSSVHSKLHFGGHLEFYYFPELGFLGTFNMFFRDYFLSES